MKYTKECIICGTEYHTYRENQQTCSKKCMGINQSGENNPNYGNKWSQEQREHLSNYKKSISEEISELVKTQWKNNEERKIKAANVMSKAMKNLFKKSPNLWCRPHTEESKKLIGIKSSEKFTDEFKDRHRQTMVENGYWRAKEEKSAYEIYFKAADWTRKMWDIVDSDLLKTHGVFNCKTNTRGCVRDHMYGRRAGFENNVPPVLLRHPANCNIITNIENIEKAKSNDISKSLDQLLKDIINYDKEWHEQEKCINIILQYQQKGTFHAELLHV